MTMLMKKMKMRIVTYSVNDKVVIILLINKVNAKSNVFMHNDTQPLVKAKQLKKQLKLVRRYVPMLTKNALKIKEMHKRNPTINALIYVSSMRMTTVTVQNNKINDVRSTTTFWNNFNKIINKH